MNTAEFHALMKEELEMQSERLQLMKSYLEDECDLLHERMMNIQDNLQFVLAELQKSKKKKAK